jgi:hypothetical protein
MVLRYPCTMTAWCSTFTMTSISSPADWARVGRSLGGRVPLRRRLAMMNTWDGRSPLARPTQRTTDTWEKGIGSGRLKCLADRLGDWLRAVAGVHPLWDLPFAESAQPCKAVEKLSRLISLSPVNRCGHRLHGHPSRSKGALQLRMHMPRITSARLF